MQSGGHGWKFLGRENGSEVEDGEHANYEGEALDGRDLVPMRRDEK